MPAGMGIADYRYGEVVEKGKERLRIALPLLRGRLKPIPKPSSSHWMTEVSKSTPIKAV
jgi:hypothetical protein